MKKQIAIVDVFNGEGYSQPEVNICDDEASARVTFAKIRNQYIRSGWTCDGVPGFTRSITRFNNGEDSGALYKFKLTHKYTLVKILPDICEVTPYLTTDCKNEALMCLKLMANDENIIDIDTRNEFLISGHSNDGFVHYQII